MFKLLERGRGDGITFAYSSLSGRPLPHSVTSESSVALRDGTADIVRVTEVQGAPSASLAPKANRRRPVGCHGVVPASG
jgi:hypothetical protein